MRSTITRSLETLMRRSEEAIQDQLVTLRNDRFVIPVRSDHRGRVAGVAHGFSSSGATVFVEPLETIESNNELQALRETEEREVTRILSTLTEELRAELPAMELAAESVAELDFVGAKAGLAAHLRAVEPSIDEENALELVEARHPLLEENLRAQGLEVVPVSLRLDTARPVMVISGANAGGKTVVLKTAGLLSLMALSGLHVPARAARIPPYRSVLADIGDRQSLAANLSTFTSHVSNIRRMVDVCQSARARPPRRGRHGHRPRRGLGAGRRGRRPLPPRVRRARRRDDPLQRAQDVRLERGGRAERVRRVRRAHFAADLPPARRRRRLLRRA